LNSKKRNASREAEGTLKSTGNPIDLSSRSKRESRKIFSRGLGGHQDTIMFFRCKPVYIAKKTLHTPIDVNDN
jgi:hypothetical protein